MCTLVILYRPAHRWPVVLGANRDEMLDRPWRPPGRHWPDRPGTVAGIDDEAGGSWMGLNDRGVVAAILNRQGSLGPAAGKRSRGELVLAALDHDSAADAAAAIGRIDALAYRPFNLVVADRTGVVWLRNEAERGPGAVERTAVPEGVSLLAERELNDTASPRIARYLPRFRDARPPDPDRGDWTEWKALLASRETAPADGPGGSMTIATDVGFGTSSSMLVALPSAGEAGRKPVWLFAPGPPGETAYAPVDAPARKVA